MRKILILSIILCLAPKAYADRLDDILKTSKKYHEEGNLERAIMNYERFLAFSHSPKMSQEDKERVRYILSELYVETNAKKNAIISFKKYLKQYPEGDFKEESQRALNALKINDVLPSLETKLKYGYFDQVITNSDYILSIDPDHKGAKEYREKALNLQVEAKEKEEEGFFYENGEWIKRTSSVDPSNTTSVIPRKPSSPTKTPTHKGSY